ncbi:IPT/TIG domain-containing protein [Bacteroides congonensis]|uniref:IPT/TIG domain-containing protein n=1 Tax=Bacteroides TaxID=816 RepID=UPI0005CC8253|nr:MULTISPECIES: IPT/TIG domain-containing protein [Bacteroides]
MKTISYYISMAVILTAAIFTGGCTDDDEKSLSLRSGELSIYDFAPNTGKGGTQLLINGEQFPLDAASISVTINEVELSILRSNEEQLLVEVPDNEAIGTAPIVINAKGKTAQSEVNFAFQKTAITGFSPAYGKVGTKVRIYVENLPAEIKNPTATYNGITAECTAEEGYFQVTIPETDFGSWPIIISFNGRTLSTGEFEYKDLLFERTITTLPGSSEFNIMCADWEYRRGGIAVDDDGNVYLTDIGNLRIRKITPDGTVSEVAGTGTENDVDWGLNWRLDNGGAGSYNAVMRPTDIKIDSKGNMYVSDDWTSATICFEPDGKALYMGWQVAVSLAIDEASNRLYSMTSNGNILLKDLNDYGGYPSSHGTVIVTGNGSPGGMDVDKTTGDLYVTNIGTHQIIKYVKDRWDDPIVIAGSGRSGHSDGAYNEATFTSPWGIAVAPDGNILVAGNGTAEASTASADQSIRYIDQKTGMVSTFAGSGTSGNTDSSFEVLSYAGVNSTIESLPAAFGAPSSVCVGKDGTVYVLDRRNNCVKKITTVEK